MDREYTVVLKTGARTYTLVESESADLLAVDAPIIRRTLYIPRGSVVISALSDIRVIAGETQCDITLAFTDGARTERILVLSGLVNRVTATDDIKTLEIENIRLNELGFVSYASNTDQQRRDSTDNSLQFIKTARELNIEVGVLDQE